MLLQNINFLFNFQVLILQTSFLIINLNHFLA